MQVGLCGYSVQIDWEDIGIIHSFFWRATDRGDGRIYFDCTVWDGRKYWIVRLHRLIMGVQLGQKCVIDHISGDHLDNRKANLRICTQAENCRNQRRRNDNRTGFKGVHYDGSHKKYRAQITVNQKKIHLGRFDFPDEAYQAYCRAAVKYHGEYANFG